MSHRGHYANGGEAFRAAAELAKRLTRNCSIHWVFSQIHFIFVGVCPDRLVDLLSYRPTMTMLYLDKMDLIKTGLHKIHALIEGQLVVSNRKEEVQCLNSWSV